METVKFISHMPHGEVLIENEDGVQSISRISLITNGFVLIEGCNYHIERDAVNTITRFIGIAPPIPTPVTPTPPINYMMYGEHKVEVTYRSNHESSILFENGQMQIVRDSELDPVRSDEEIRMDFIVTEALGCVGVHPSIAEKDILTVTKDLIEAGYRLVTKDDIKIMTDIANIALLPDMSNSLKQIIERLK